MPEIDGIEYTSPDSPVTEPARTRRTSKLIRLVGIALLAFIAIIAVVLLTPGLRKGFLPQQRPAVSPEPVAAPAEDPGTDQAVPELWEKLDLNAIPDSIAQDLRLGRYYYDRRLPGNFGLAIHYWQQAMAKRGESGGEKLRLLVASAEQELARQFSDDSVDVLVFLKQGKQEEAVVLLERMRADYLDIYAPQYVWTSRMLARGRR